jgi:endothelin-converting enzyme/putative endopeptidase
VSRASHFKNKTAATAFESHRLLSKIGKPVDREDWEMTPPTVNAGYEPSLNEMAFPAGILERPFFDRRAPPPVNYGGIGYVMGHELTHGFDDEGRQFDGLGNLRDWWSPTVSKEFDRRAECVQKQFDSYVVVDDLHQNGKLTLGENIADLGGMKLAFAAYLAARGGKGAQPLPGSKLTDAQAFFVGSAQVWCGKRRPENERLRVQTDPHSTPRWRVNGPMSNLSEFAEAFQCKQGAKMIRADRCQVW